MCSQLDVHLKLYQVDKRKCVMQYFYLEEAKKSVPELTYEIEELCLWLPGSWILDPPAPLCPLALPSIHCTEMLAYNDEDYFKGYYELFYVLMSAAVTDL